MTELPIRLKYKVDDYEYEPDIIIGEGEYVQIGEIYKLRDPIGTGDIKQGTHLKVDHKREDFIPPCNLVAFICDKNGEFSKKRARRKITLLGEFEKW